MGAHIDTNPAGLLLGASSGQSFRKVPWAEPTVSSSWTAVAARFFATSQWRPSIVSCGIRMRPDLSRASDRIWWTATFVTLCPFTRLDKWCLVMNAWLFKYAGWAHAQAVSARGETTLIGRARPDKAHVRSLHYLRQLSDCYGNAISCKCSCRCLDRKFCAQ